jgi:hypothetical protein
LDEANDELTLADEDQEFRFVIFPPLQGYSEILFSRYSLLIVCVCVCVCVDTCMYVCIFSV